MHAASGAARTLESAPRRRARGVVLAVLLAAVAGMANEASALPEFLWGFDFDQVSHPRFPQAGFGSVTTCTFAAGEAPGAVCAPYAEFAAVGQVAAGYLGGHRPFTDTRFQPPDSSVEADLWTDGHMAPPIEAVLRIAGLEPGAAYVLFVFTRGGAAAGIATYFSVGGQPIATLVSDPQLANDVSSRVTLEIPVVAGPEGWVDFGFRSDLGAGVGGVVHGVALAIPEPGSLALAAAGLALLGGLRRVR